MPQTPAQRAWYIKNRERLLKKANEKYVKKGRPKPTYKSEDQYRKEYAKLYRENNKEKLQEYYKKVSKTDRYKRLRAARQGKRRATKIKATPFWANIEKIKEFYMNCPKDYHVDHIVPLQGKTVTGLHVLSNLQYLSAGLNISKGNKFGASYE